MDAAGSGLPYDDDDDDLSDFSAPGGDDDGDFGEQGVAGDVAGDDDDDDDEDDDEGDGEPLQMGGMGGADSDAGNNDDLEGHDACDDVEEIGAFEDMPPSKSKNKPDRRSTNINSSQYSAS